MRGKSQRGGATKFRRSCLATRTSSTARATTPSPESTAMSKGTTDGRSNRVLPISSTTKLLSEG
ncbi:MAG: hypothetical protein DMD43_00335 [Gemmatimonadetes bacterium]|nr:MAG: hypothetical protein DMD43_00335 [Gemmatimonadota bacterium]